MGELVQDNTGTLAFGFLLIITIVFIVGIALEMGKNNGLIDTLVAHIIKRDLRRTQYEKRPETFY